MVKAPRSEKEAAAEKRQGTEGTGEGRRSPEDRGFFWEKGWEWQLDCGKSAWAGHISGRSCISTGLVAASGILHFVCVSRFRWSAMWTCGTLLGDGLRWTHAVWQCSPLCSCVTLVSFWIFRQKSGWWVYIICRLSKSETCFSCLSVFDCSLLTSVDLGLYHCVKPFSPLISFSHFLCTVISECWSVKPPLPLLALCAVLDTTVF